MHTIRFTEKKLARRLALIAPLVYRQSLPLPHFRFCADAEARVAPDVDDSSWPTLAPGDAWGQRDQTFTLRTTFRVPTDWEPPLVLHLPIGDSNDFVLPEALVYVDGIPVQGINARHQEVPLAPGWCDGREHTLALYGWCSTLRPASVVMGVPALAQVDAPTREFVAAARVALGVLAELAEHDPTHSALLNALDAAFLRLDLRDPLGGSAFYASVREALPLLREGIAAAGAPLPVDVLAAGHAHIDVAWLWALEQTRHKVTRTFTSVLRLMEEFPDFHFTQSQAQLYRFVAEDTPELLDEIRTRVAEGRWEVTGGTWVEMDTNATGAESLARQFLLGRRLYRELFGPVDTPVLWLPDTFGYSAALPQLIRAAGLKYFITSKISWNQYNHLPYDSFWWEGIDGSRVLTHFITTPINSSDFFSTYNGDLSPLQVMGTWRNYQQQAAHREVLASYGWGNGGGGPDRAMLENAGELAAHPGMPRVRLGRVGDFCARLETSAAQLPVWNGELYLEIHRGTYTSQGRTKRANRKAEIALHNAEFLAAWAAQRGAYAYPHAALTHAWELVCLNQFHDILPGSSIGEVYTQAAQDYAAAQAAAQQVCADALAALATACPSETALLVVNPTGFEGPRVGLAPISLPAGHTLVDLKTRGALLTQPVEGGTLTALPACDAYSIRALGVAEMAQPPYPPPTLLEQTADGVALENSLLRVELDRNGELTRLYDKGVGREVLPPGARANVFQAFEDRPLNWDAWDVDIFYDEKCWAAEPAHAFTVIEEGPLRVGVEVRRRILNSELVQRITLSAGSRRVDFDTRLDWHDRHVLLKVAFPVDILSSTATYEIQWGTVERPTHRNTSWDWARFEVCAQKWADLSEGNYGVSLLNDCKYGHDIQGHVMRLTLLKSATSPDPEADQGDHEFTYSLLPHPGDWRRTTSRAAYALNYPLLFHAPATPPTGQQAAASLLAVDREHVIIETVKQAEDGHGLIVRLYEAQRTRGRVALKAGFPLATAYRCNLLEETEVELPVRGDKVAFDIRPYEIVTLRLVEA